VKEIVTVFFSSSSYLFFSLFLLWSKTLLIHLSLSGPSLALLFKTTTLLTALGRPTGLQCLWKGSFYLQRCPAGSQFTIRGFHSSIFLVVHWVHTNSALLTFLDTVNLTVSKQSANNTHRMVYPSRALILAAKCILRINCDCFRNGTNQPMLIMKTNMFRLRWELNY
jgi:hypothetical protein